MSEGCPNPVPEAFERELTALINKHSLENQSDTPDYILASYMCRALEAFNLVTDLRSDWHFGSQTEMKEST